jgi:hypothetical protein
MNNTFGLTLQPASNPVPFFILSPFGGFERCVAYETFWLGRSW